ncbi:hypothetical protein V3C99_018062 [Haemonchus contortus]
MVLILIAAIAVFICQACFKQRDQNRVHIAESSRLVRDSERRMAKPGSSTVNHCQGASGFEQEANPSLAQMSSLHATMHYNQAEVASSMPREPRSLHEYYLHYLCGRQCRGASTRGIEAFYVADVPMNCSTARI